MGGHIVRALDVFREATILNDGRPTRVLQGSCPDLTSIFKPFPFDIVWDVFDDPLDSDHFPIAMQISSNQLFFGNCNNGIHLAHIDWGVLTNKVDSRIRELSDTNAGNFTDEYDRFCDILMKSIAESGGKVFTGGRDGRRRVKAPSDAVWWDPACTSNIEERRDAFKAFKLRYTRENSEVYKQIKKSTARNINKQKRSSFIGLVSSMNPYNPLQKT